MPDEIPPSSTPTTSPHEEIPPPILTPVTFQFHPSTIQSYPAFPLNTTSPNYYSTQIASNYPSGIVQQGSFGSSFNSMSSLTQSASQPVEFTKTRSKNSKPANARGGKSQSSTSYKVRATTSKPLQSPSSVKKPRKGKNVQKLDEDAPCRKPPVRWEDQKNEKGESAISILLNWITTYENWSLYKSNNNYRSKTLEIITAYLVENGIHDRSGKIVASKIGLLETQFNEAKRWIDQSGQGAMNCLEAEKEKNGWEDEDPAYVARKKLLVDSYIEARCKYYWQLEPVMGQRDKATRLASVNSAQRDNPDDSLACLGLTENESHLQGNVDLDQTQYNNRHIRDISNEDMSNFIDGGLSEDDQTDLITANQTPQKSIDPTPDSSVSKSSTRPSVKKGYKYKSSAETQVKQLLTRNSDAVKSSITDLEDTMIQANQSSNVLGEAILSIATILKPKEDPRSLLSKEDQIKQAQLDAQLHSLKVESAQLDVDRTKRAMDMEYRVARGKFIAQVMAENNLTLEQAKEVAAEVFPSIDSERTGS